MSSDSLKISAVKGLLWTFFEKVSAQTVHFVIGIILARLLSPSEFGIIGMITIFTALAQTFTDSGLSSALIQKKNCSDADYSTIFYFNIVVAVICYGILYMASPYIASFYKMPQLNEVTRVVSLSIIISGLTSVQNTKLTKELRFKEQSINSILSMIITGIAGIVLAYAGFGVWALVAQVLLGKVFSSLCVWSISKWMPKIEFSKESFIQMWGFGSKILVSSLINTIYSNIYTLVIGKAFSPQDVGYYNRGNQYALLPGSVIQNVALKVNYPLLAKIQDDDERLLRAYQKMTSLPFYVLFPILVGMAVTAPSLIPVMIGDKWQPCVPMMQILCIGYMFSPLTHFNLNLLYVKGRTDLVLKLELIKKPIGFIILFASIPTGIIGMIVGKAVYEFIAFSFNCYYTGKILNFGELKQLKVLVPIILNCMCMALVVHFTMMIGNSNIAKLCIGVVSGIFSYILFSLLTKDENLIEIITILRSYMKKRT